MTVHRDFANKSCPGTSLYERHAQIAAEVNRRLGADDSSVQDGASAAGSTDSGSNSLYRVRKTWEDSKTQKGAYKILENAKKCADANPGYTVFNADGKAVYSPSVETESAVAPASGVPFQVKIDITDLNIRTGPGTNYAKTGKFTGAGVFTITEVKDGPGSTKGWGRLKSNAGWVALEFTTKI